MPVSQVDKDSLPLKNARQEISSLKFVTDSFHNCLAGSEVYIKKKKALVTPSATLVPSKKNKIKDRRLLGPLEGSREKHNTGVKNNYKLLSTSSSSFWPFVVLICVLFLTSVVVYQFFVYASFCSCVPETKLILKAVKKKKQRFN